MKLNSVLNATLACSVLALLGYAAVSFIPKLTHTSAAVLATTERKYLIENVRKFDNTTTSVFMTDVATDKRMVQTYRDDQCFPVVIALGIGSVVEVEVKLVEGKNNPSIIVDLPAICDELVIDSANADLSVFQAPKPTSLQHML